MINIPALRGLLCQTLSTPDLHTAMLVTSSGQLVSFASDPPRAKDEVRILVGLCTEVWRETMIEGYGMVDSEYGKLVVFPVSDHLQDAKKTYVDPSRPVMLLVLNATDSVSWEELQHKGKTLSIHLAKSLDPSRNHNATSKRATRSTAGPSAIRG